MSQSRFSIVLVGVSALLRRPLVSRLRPAAFTARGSGGFRRSALPSVSAFAARRVGLRAHGFRFSACAASELLLGGLVLLPSASAFAARQVGASAGRVGLRAHDFRFSARTASGLPSAGWRFRLPLRRLPLGGLAFGLTASAFRHAPLRSCPRRVGLRAHDFRFSARTASGLPSASWRFCSAGWFFCLPLRRLPLGGLTFGLTTSAFGTHRFGVALGELVLLPFASGLLLDELAFGLTASAFRHAPLRRLSSASWPSGSRLPLFGTRRFGDCRSAGWSSDSRLPLFGTHRFGDCRWASWPSGSRLLLFGMRRSAPPYRRSEGRRNTPTRHLFHFKTLISTC